MSQTKAQLLDGKVATIEFTGGSASTPSITFTGDVNTGLYSPGADQVAISTGGTGRLFVDASGNVGIGTASGGRKLEITGIGTGTTLDGVNVSNGTAQGAFLTTGASYTYRGIGSNQIWLNANGTTLQVGTVQSHPLIFSTNSFEVARFDSSGRLGLGTSSPGYLFTAAGAGGSAVLNLLETGVRSWGIRAGGALTNTFDIADFTAGQTRLTIDSSGRVGIGTTSPSSFVEGSQSVNAATEIKITNASNGTAALAGFAASNGTNAVAFGIGGTGYSGYAQTRANGAYIYSGTSAGIGFSADNASGYITFGTGSGGSERARIDSSGRLLVGTSSTLAIDGGANALVQAESNYAFYARYRNNDAFDSSIFFSKSRAAGAQTVVQNGDRLGSIVFSGADGANNINAAIIRAEVDGTPGANDMPGRLVFSTTADGASSPTERMRISSDGGTLWRSVGTTSTHDIGNNNTSFAGYATTISTFRNTTNNSYSFIGCVRQGFAVALEVRDSGNVFNTNGVYGAFSDIKLKENIVDASSQWSDIKALQVRKYNFKEETGQPTHTQIGLIAQEIELVSPGLVNESPDRDSEGNDLGTVTKSVNYSVLYMKAVKALQEAIERIETLEAGNADLLSRVIALEGE